MEFVGQPWLLKQLDGGGLTVIDPRSTMRYLQGHMKSAVSLPAMKLFDKTSFELLQERKLAALLGGAGVDTNRPVVLYDSYDGQSAAMLAWVLEYLGHPKVGLLSSFFERWVKDGHEVMYRPVKAERRTFSANPNRRIRASLRELTEERKVKLLDVRSRREFTGEDSAGNARPGHIPGAINIPWTHLLGSNGQFLLPRRALLDIFRKRGLKENDDIVTYCRSGPRAAVGYLALRSLGYQNARLFDGSFYQWAHRPELPVET